MNKSLESNDIQMNVDFIEGEEWRVPENFNDYRISNYGRVYSTLTDKILKPDVQKNEYLDVRIKNCDGDFQHVKVHRLVGEAFCPNPKNKRILHHLDTNRKNNHSENLIFLDFDEHIELHKALRKKKKKALEDDTSEEKGASTNESDEVGED